MVSVRRPIDDVVLNCWVTDTKETACRSPLTVGRLCSGKVDDQSLRLDLDARDVGVDKAAVVNRRRCFEMLPNRPYDQRLNLGCRHSAD
jgi:hypothetical protein